MKFHETLRGASYRLLGKRNIMKDFPLHPDVAPGFSPAVPP